MSKRLTKSNTNIVLTGTLAGIAEYFKIDPTIIRILYVVVTFGGMGFPFILYFVLYLLIPKKTTPPRSDTYQSTRSNQRKEAEKIDDDEWGEF